MICLLINGMVNANSKSSAHKGQYGSANKRHKSSSSDISSPVSSACSNSSVFTQSTIPSCTISRTPSVSTHNGNGHHSNNNGNGNGNTSNSNNNNNNNNNNISNQRRTSVSSNSSINSNYPPVSLFASSTAGNSFQNNGTNGANNINISNGNNGFNEPGRRKRTTTVSSGVGPHDQVAYNDSKQRMNSVSSSASTNSSSIVQLKQNQRSSNGQKSLFETFNQSINGSLNNGLRKVRTERSRSVAVPHVQPPITDPEITHSRTQSLSIHTPSNFLCDDGQFSSGSLPTNGDIADNNNLINELNSGLSKLANEITSDFNHDINNSSNARNENYGCGNVDGNGQENSQMSSSLEKLPSFTKLSMLNQKLDS
ncbi:unnamed protein product [[Candida] boidinii]|nr:unnamed protein product [[Candida] boidinii]